MNDKKNRMGQGLIATFLVVGVILITLIHYYTTDGSKFLLHEISQRLYYIPIIVAAYTFGLRGSVTISMLSGVVYLFHISEHRYDTRPEILNQYAEVLMFLVVGVITGLLAGAEKRQKHRFEKASAELSAAYQELRNTMNLLIRADRLKSVGEVAAAIVHEIRNPLGAIKGAAEIIEAEIPLESPRREFITVIEKEVDRLNKLVTEFLKFARPRQPEKVPSDLNQIIKSVITFTSKEAAKHGIEFKTKLDLQLPAVPVDSEQMRQVLLNLILNAIHAMPQGGIVEIESRHSRNVVELTVRDDGVGIDPAIRDKIFDPFFTTKSEGSGLGLSVAYQLIKQHDGEIELVELNSPGALFVIRLPMTKTETAESPAKNDSHKTEAESKSSDSTAVRAEKL